MENTVNDLVDLKGWRKPGEELPYLQGALLADLHNSKRANSVMNIVILIIIPLCVNGILSILSFLLNEYYTLNILELLIFVVICAALVIVCIFSIKGFYRSLFPKEGIYKSLIKNGDFTVCDAVIKDIHYIHRQDSVDTMMANLADKEGIYCKKAIQCDWKRWLKMGSHVYLTCYEIDFGSYCFKIYPSIENGENAKAGAYGLDLYHKYMVKKNVLGSGLKKGMLILIIGLMMLLIPGGCMDVINYTNGRYVQIDATISFVHNYVTDNRQHANGYIEWEYNGQIFSNENEGQYMDFKDDAKVGDEKTIWIDTQTGELVSGNGIVTSISASLWGLLILIFASRKLYLMKAEK